MSSISPANQQVGQRTHQDAAENKSAITDRRTQALLEAPILPTLGRLAAPNIFLAFMQGMVNLADIWFISRIGTNGLAGT